MGENKKPAGQFANVELGNPMARIMKREAEKQKRLASWLAGVFNLEAESVLLQIQHFEEQ